MNLRGAVAVVTGGARRIGRATAIELARAGCHVVVNYDRSRAAAVATARAACAFGVRGEAVRADVGCADEADALIAQTYERFGRLDLLVANAGAFRRTPIRTVTADDWDAMIRANLDTFFYCAQRAGARMRRRGGAIVALADVAALRPWADYVPYSVAKGCVVALVRALAVELAPRVRVNAVAPGPVLFPRGFAPAQRHREIDRTLLQRQGSPADIADAVVFLARAEYITGTVLPVDGGRLLHDRDR